MTPELPRSIQLRNRSIASSPDVKHLEQSKWKNELDAKQVSKKVVHHTRIPVHREKSDVQNNPLLIGKVLCYNIAQFCI